MAVDEKTNDSRFNWPYATSYLLETLDPELIEAHAEHILSRALNIGRVVGFIGAGVAMSYGRISWRTLVQTEIRRVTAKLDEAKRDTKKWNSPDAEDAKRLWATLNTLKPARSDIRPERYPMLFQVSEQLDKALNVLLGKTGAQGLRAHAATLTIDDTGHAYQILLDALCYGQRKFDPAGNNRKAPEGAAYEFIETVMGGSFNPHLLQQSFHDVALVDRKTAKPVADSPYRLFFDADYIEELFGQVVQAHSTREPYFEILSWAVWYAFEKRPAGDRPKRAGASPSIGATAQPDKTQTTSEPSAQRRGERRYLLPTDRYLLGVLLHLSKHEPDPTIPNGGWHVPAAAFFDRIADDIADYVKSIECSGSTQKKPPKLAPTTRHGLVTQWRDPLLYMQEGLRINRFITTNFDHEVERLFRDQAFRSAGTTDVEHSLMRPQFKEIVFNNNRAGELTAFAVRDRSLNGEVVHLHGRAERKSEQKEDDVNIVVTETDYQRLYLRPDASRKLVDDAIRLAFGSSPILFVGSNMGEDDLLRPLRQFMSGPARLGDRVAIALVPALYDRPRRTEEKIALLGRHGVYEVHFGNAKLTQQDGGTHEFEWLAWYLALLNPAREILKFFADADDGSNLQADYDAADQVWIKLKSSYDDGPELTPACQRALEASLPAQPDPKLAEEARAKRVKDARKAARKGDAPNFWVLEPAEIEGCRAGAQNAIELTVEVLLLNSALAWLGTNIPLYKQRAAPTGVASKDEDERFRREHPRVAKALLVALEGASDSALAIFTCAKLDKAKRDWDRWKDAWFRLPDSAKAADSLTDSEVAPELRKTTEGRTLVAENAQVTHRHQIGMKSTPHDDPMLGRFYSGAPSQSLFGLVNALGERDDGARRFRNARGRRILLLPSRRGMGKGHFFSSLEDCVGTPKVEDIPGDPPRVLELLRALNPIGGEDPAYDPSRWVGLGFFGMSFSQEVMSAFDRLTELLFASLKRSCPEIAAFVGFERFDYDRIERLRSALSGWNELGKRKPENPDRVLIAFNAFSTFYDREGREKNGQLKKLCELLYSDAFALAPIDLILQCRSDRLPMALVGPDAARDVIPLLPPRGNPKGRAKAERFLLAGGVGPRGPRPMHRPGTEISWQSRPETGIDGVWRAMLVRQQKEAEPAPVPGRGSAVAIHVLEEARAITIASAYFPRVVAFIARALMWASLRKRCAQNDDLAREIRDFLSRQDEDRLYGGAFEPHAQRSREEMRVSFNRLQNDNPETHQKIFAPSLMAYIAIVFEFCPPSEPHPSSKAIKNYREAVETAAKDKQPKPCHVAADTLLRQAFGPGECLAAKNCAPSEKVLDYVCSTLFEEVNSNLDKYLRELFEYVNDGRFLLTLVLTAAYEATAELAIPGKNHPIGGTLSDPHAARQPLKAVDRVANQMMKWIDEVKLALRGMPDSARPNAIIDEVLTMMRQRCERSDALPIPLKWEPDKQQSARPAHAESGPEGGAAPSPEAGTGAIDVSVKAAPDDPAGPDPEKEDAAEPAGKRMLQPFDDETTASMKLQLHQLMVEVVWHLAIIGQPVEQSVLEHCPRIKAICAQIKNREGQPAEISISVKNALGLATNRCLIFRLTPNPNVSGDRKPGGSGKGASDTVRFTVHRLVQRYVFRSLGASTSEFPDADQFTLSFYASQPDDLPRLSTEGHIEISKVIAALSNYPGNANLERSEAVPAPTDTAQSAGVLSAEDETLESQKDLRRRLRAALGIMRSIYSVAVLSRFDRKFGDQAEMPEVGFFEEHRRSIRWLLKHGAELTQENETQSPFYAEEIVWLCNECAVMSMVEGRLSDAHALFALAFQAVKEIEPDETGRSMCGSC